LVRQRDSATRPSGFALGLEGSSPLQPLGRRASPSAWRGRVLSSRSAVGLRPRPGGSKSSLSAPSRSYKSFKSNQLCHCPALKCDDRFFQSRTGLTPFSAREVIRLKHEDKWRSRGNPDTAGSLFAPHGASMWRRDRFTARIRRQVAQPLQRVSQWHCMQSIPTTRDNRVRVT
jgi:hypothetical protein